MTGKVAEIESVSRSDEAYPCLRAVCAWSGGDSQPANIFNPAGIETHPFPTDTALTVCLTSTGETALVGVVSANNETTAPGDTVVYSRSAPDQVRARVAVRANGDIVLANGSAQIVAFSGGGVFINGTDVEIEGSPVTINGVVISAAGVITLPDGKVLNDHDHDLPGGGKTEVNN